MEEGQTHFHFMRQYSSKTPCNAWCRAKLFSGSWMRGTTTTPKHSLQTAPEAGHTTIPRLEHPPLSSLLCLQWMSPLACPNSALVMRGVLSGRYISMRIEEDWSTDFHEGKAQAQTDVNAKEGQQEDSRVFLLALLRIHIGLRLRFSFVKIGRPIFLNAHRDVSTTQHTTHHQSGIGTGERRHPLEAEK